MTQARARGFVELSYNFNDIDTTGGLVSDYSITQNIASFIYGSGEGQINAAVQNTGILSSGSFINIDLRSVPKNILGYTSTVSFTGIKGFCLVNNSTSRNSNIAIRATGTNAFTNLFNGGSGNLLVKPSAGFIYIDPYGIPVSTGNKNIQIFDIGGSGASYTYSVFGNV